MLTSSPLRRMSLVLTLCARSHLTRPDNHRSGKEDTRFEESEKAGQNVQRLTLRQPLIDHHRPA